MIDNAKNSTDTRDPGGMEEETMADSESQILQPLESQTASSTTVPMKAALEMRDGNCAEASSREDSSCSWVGSKCEDIEEETAEGEEKSML